MKKKKQNFYIALRIQEKWNIFYYNYIYGNEYVMLNFECTKTIVNCSLILKKKKKNRQIFAWA